MADLTIRIDDFTMQAGPDVEREEFVIRGVAYEMDLNAKNREEWEKALAPFLAVARRMSIPFADVEAVEPDTYVQLPDRELRVWARENGLPSVPRGGRVNGDIREAHRQLTVHQDGSALARLRSDPRYAPQSGDPDATGVTGETGDISVNVKHPRKSGGSRGPTAGTSKVS